MSEAHPEVRLSEPADPDLVEVRPSDGIPEVVITPDEPGVPLAGPAPDPKAGRRPANGLTGRGVITLVFAATMIGGLADMAIGGHRGHLFGVLFAVSAAVGALAVRRRELSTAMIGPPLVYCVSIFVMCIVDRADVTGGLLSREAFYLGNAFVTGAPAIWAGTALAVGIAWYRGKPERR